MNKKEHYLISAICFLSGIIIGFLIAPIKQGIGNNCGSGNNSYYYKDEENKVEEHKAEGNKEIKGIKKIKGN